MLLLSPLQLQSSRNCMHIDSIPHSSIYTVPGSGTVPHMHQPNFLQLYARLYGSVRHQHANTTAYIQYGCTKVVRPLVHPTPSLPSCTPRQNIVPQHGPTSFPNGATAHWCGAQVRAHADAPSRAIGNCSHVKRSHDDRREREVVLPRPCGAV